MATIWPMMLSERTDTSVRRRTLGPALEPSVLKSVDEKNEGAAVCRSAAN
ncbi:MAG: hypothetical protein ABL996_00570 [Micropepsaceae bacterium]